MTSTDDLIRPCEHSRHTAEQRFLRPPRSHRCRVVGLRAPLVFSVFGIRQDFADMAVRMPFAFKVVYAGVLVVRASVVALYAATPGASATALSFIASGHSSGLWCHIRSTGSPIMGRTSTALPSAWATFFFFRCQP